jgi:hypothetical protein
MGVRGAAGVGGSAFRGRGHPVVEEDACHAQAGGARRGGGRGQGGPDPDDAMSST